MTHTRNSAASAPSTTDGQDRSHAAAAQSHRQTSPSRSDRRTLGRRKRTLPVDGQTGRAYRARAEPMLVRPLRDGRYVVETDGGTYVVDVEREACTCPDSAIRDARCKHRRRVALEIDAGLLPGPNERERVCAVCGGPAFVPIDTESETPVLCKRHDHDPGDLVQDRETGSLLVVVDALGERADATRTDEGRLVAAYETNESYGGQEPVFAIVYVDSLSVDDSRPRGEARTIGAIHHIDDRLDIEGIDEARRYLFPASRLRPVAAAGRSPGDVDDASGLFAVVDVSEA